MATHWQPIFLSQLDWGWLELQGAVKLPGVPVDIDGSYWSPFTRARRESKPTKRTPLVPPPSFSLLEVTEQMGGVSSPLFPLHKTWNQQPRHTHTIPTTRS